MRIEVFVAIDSNGNVGIADSQDDAYDAIDAGGGPDRGPVVMATFAIEMNAPKLIEGPLVVVPDAKVQPLQPEIVEA